MAPTTPQGEPTSIAAGDSWIWTQTFADYPSSEGWSVSYAFRGVDGGLVTSASEVTLSGTTATVTIPASRTATLTAGLYRWTAYATGSGSYAGRRDTIGTGVLTVAPNRATQAAGDVEFIEEAQLAAAQETLRRKLEEDISAYTITQRQVVTIEIAALQKTIGQLKRIIWRKRNPTKPWPEHRVVFS